MKNLLLSFITFSTFQVFALDWYEFDLDKTYTLEKEIRFQKENIILQVGDQFKLRDIIGLSINVSIFQFDVKKCPGPNLITELIIIDPTLMFNDPSVGVQLQKSCLLEVYVEMKDIFSKSLFTLKRSK
jgi:hypothetical protein